MFFSISPRKKKQTDRLGKKFNSNKRKVTNFAKTIIVQVNERFIKITEASICLTIFLVESETWRTLNRS